MSSSKEYLNFVLEQLSSLEGISHRTMMGEYMIYYQGKIAAYLCDDRFLVKTVPSAIHMLPNAKREPPYAGAKDMLLVDNLDNREFLAELFHAMLPELPAPKPKKKKESKK